jgi:hypothetical protein
MKTGAWLALGLGAGYFLGGTKRMWWSLIAQVGGARHSVDTRSGRDFASTGM